MASKNKSKDELKNQNEHILPEKKSGEHNSIQSINLSPTIPSIIQQGDNAEIILNSNGKSDDYKSNSDYALLKAEVDHLKEVIELKDKEYKIIEQTKNDEIKVLKEIVESYEKTKKRIGYR